MKKATLKNTWLLAAVQWELESQRERFDAGRQVFAPQDAEELFAQFTLQSAGFGSPVTKVWVNKVIAVALIKDITGGRVVKSKEIKQVIEEAQVG